MTNYNWNYPTTVWVGKDRAKDLKKACDEIKTLKPLLVTCLLYTSPSPRDPNRSRMPSSA